MTCWAIIPAKAPGKGKVRLAGVLDAGERARLAEAMLAHVVQAAMAAHGINRVCLIGPARPGMDADVWLLTDPGGGLNAAASSALAEAARAGAARAIVIHADLPKLVPLDCELLAAAPAATIAIAPDRHGIGTNALSLPLPESAAFRFAFGADSFAAHQAEANRLGLKLEVIRSPGLESDVDEPADLPDAQAVWQTGRKNP